MGEGSAITVTPLDRAQSVVSDVDRSVSELLRYREHVLKRCRTNLSELRDLDRLVRGFETLLGLEPNDLPPVDEPT